MILSNLQAALLVQLWAAKDSPVDCFAKAMSNTKTAAFATKFVDAKLFELDVANHTLTPIGSALSKECVANGLVGDDGELTERGEELTTQVISESLKSMFLNHRAKRH